jgi:hypothetical protein
MNMAQVKPKEQAADDHQPAGGMPAAPVAAFVREADLRDESMREPLGGCDVEHCQRMHE